MKKLVAMGVLFLGLGSFVYFYEIQGQEGREREQQLEESLFRLESEDAVSGLTIERPGHDTVILAKESDTWMIESPVSSVADENAVSSLLGRINGAKRARTLEEGANLSDFGLDGEVTRLSVRTADGDKALLLGDKAFKGSQMYARFSDGQEVFLTSDLLRGPLEKEADDWRDRSLLRFERSNLEEIEINVGLKQIGFEKRGEDWYLTTPVQEKADRSAVSSLLTTLDSARIEEFVAEQPEDLATYGLDEPAASVRIREAGQDEWKRIEIGAEGEDTGRFARDPSRTPVVRVSSSLLNDLNKELFEFRDKDIIDVDSVSITRLRLQRSSGELAIRHEDFKWIVESPEEQKDQEALAYKFWYPIDDMEFETLDEAGVGDFSSPDVTLTLEVEDGSSAVFLFIEEDDAYRARRESDGRQGRISRESFDKLLIEPAELG